MLKRRLSPNWVVEMHHKSRVSAGPPEMAVLARPACSSRANGASLEEAAFRWSTDPKGPVVRQAITAIAAAAVLVAARGVLSRHDEGGAYKKNSGGAGGWLSTRPICVGHSSLKNGAHETASQ